MFTIPKEQQSKNENAEKIMGLRPVGIPVYFPFELGYYCPICSFHMHDQPVFKDGDIADENAQLNLHFSEYIGFMWCEHCNIDIPSFLCLKADTKEKVALFTEYYLDMIQELKSQKEEQS